MINYQPQILVKPPRMVSVPTAWNEMELGLVDIIDRFRVLPDRALEFGVDYGFSTAALANYFKRVIGVDTFEGDEHAGWRDNLKQQTESALAGFDNIELRQCDYRDWIVFDDRHYDLIHIDIVHHYDDTFRCGMWAVEHSDVVIMHDTIAFPEVMRAAQDIASQSGMKFYHWAHRHGLGILSRRDAR